jgi:hypothetical protein
LNGIAAFRTWDKFQRQEKFRDPSSELQLNSMQPIETWAKELPAEAVADFIGQSGLFLALSPHNFFSSSIFHCL